MTDFYNLDAAEKSQRLKEIAKVFFRLGFFAYGGPAAHTAMMNEELVEKRKWVSRERFLDLMSATHIIPGPNSTELAIHMGHERGGWKGLFIAGLTFILPAFFLVVIFAWVYTNYGMLPQVQDVLTGVKAVIIAVIANALISLFRSAVKKSWFLVILAAVMAGAWFGLNEILLLAFGALAMYAIQRFVFDRQGTKGKLHAFLPLPLLGGLFPFQNITYRFAEVGTTRLAPNAVRFMTQVATQPSVLEVFLRFLKIGAILYGSGYVLVAYLESEFVVPGMLTSQQLLDAVAVGQLTPGPVFTTASFVGYLLQGLPGAVVGTIGIFLPSFLLVGLLTKITAKLRSSLALSRILDGVNVASLGLMAVTTFHLAQTSLINVWLMLIAIASFVLLRFFKVNSIWLILAGGVIGYFII